MSDEEKGFSQEEANGCAWRQILIVVAGSLGLGVVCRGGAIALDGSRTSALTALAEVLGAVGTVAFVVFGITLVGSAIAGVIFSLIRP